MSYTVWIGFLAFIVLMVVLDLGVFHRKAHAMRVREALAAASIDFDTAEVTQLPSVTVAVEASKALKVLRLVDALEELDDVQQVYGNFDISDDVMAEVG